MSLFGNSEKWPHIGAVLTGGASRRMGTAKANLVLPTGQTMIEAVIQVVADVCTDVVTVGSSVGGRRFVADLRSGAGPLGGIEALLASGLDQNYLICPNDIPMLSPDLVRRLTVHTVAIATALQTEDGRIQSLPIRLSAAALPTVTGALDAGRNAIHHVLNRLEVDRIAITDDEARGLRNVNTPGDFNSIA